MAEGKTINPRFQGVPLEDAFLLVKKRMLTEEELRGTSEYKGVYETYFDFLDPEEPDQMVLHTQVNMALELIAAEKMEAAKIEAQELEDKRIEAGRKYALDNNLNPDNLEKAILLEFGTWVLSPQEIPGDNGDSDSEPLNLIRRDDETMMLVTPSGQIISFLDAPIIGEDDRETLLEWVGERRTEAMAKAEGLRAEKQVWIDKINATYDSQINAQERRIKGLEWVYGPMAKQYLQEIVDASQQTKKPVRQVKIGLLKLAFSKTRAKLDVLLPEHAVRWLRRNGAHEAIKIEQSVLKTQVTDDLRRKINDDPSSGMVADFGGKDTFNMS